MLTLPFPPSPHLSQFPNLSSIASVLFTPFFLFSVVYLPFSCKHTHPKQAKEIVFLLLLLLPRAFSLGFLYFPLPFLSLCLYLQTVFQSLTVTLPFFFTYHLCYMISYNPS